MQQFAQRRCSASEFDLSMSRSDIGNFLGIAEETVCRIFARFQDDGLVSSDRHIKLNDVERKLPIIGPPGICGIPRFPVSKPDPQIPISVSRQRTSCFIVSRIPCWFLYARRGV
ncbi:MAG: helix-turn-helix domain-containing protein [Nitrosospira sp.]